MDAQRSTTTGCPTGSTLPGRGATTPARKTDGPPDRRDAPPTAPRARSRYAAGDGTGPLQRRPRGPCPAGASTRPRSTTTARSSPARESRDAGGPTRRTSYAYGDDLRPSSIDGRRRRRHRHHRRSTRDDDGLRDGLRAVHVHPRRAGRARRRRSPTTALDLALGYDDRRRARARARMTVARHRRRYDARAHARRGAGGSRGKRGDRRRRDEHLRLRVPADGQLETVKDARGTTLESYAYDANGNRTRGGHGDDLRRRRRAAEPRRHGVRVRRRPAS